MYNREVSLHLWRLGWIVTAVAYLSLLFMLQTGTTFLVQAIYMRLEFETFTIPAASLSIFDMIAVLMLIPIMDHVVYPLVSYCGISFTPLRRIGIGIILASASVIVAGVVEIHRRSTWIDGGFCMQTVFGETRNASSVSVFLANSTVYVSWSQWGAYDHHRYANPLPCNINKKFIGSFSVFLLTSCHYSTSAVNLHYNHRIQTRDLRKGSHPQISSLC